MNREELLSAISHVDSELDDYFAPDKAVDLKKPKIKLSWKTLVTACLALVLISGAFGVYAITAEAAEYREAVAFFDENALSPDGLSRSEIKAVYRDITMKAFSHTKTAEVLNILSVKLYQTDLGSLDKESLAEFWEAWRSGQIHLPTRNKEHTGIWYNMTFKRIGGTSYRTVECYDGETPLWEYSVTFNSNLECAPMKEGVLLYGRRDRVSSSSGWAYAIMLDNRGKVAWEYKSNEEGSAFDAAVINGEEIAFFGHDYDEEWQWSTTFTLMSANGEVKKRRKTAEESYVTYDSAVKIGDSYFVKTAGAIVSFTADGEKTETKSYFDGDDQYLINDMVYHEGRVLLFAHKAVTEEAWKKIREFEIQYPFQKPLGEEEKKIYTELIRSIFDVTLFICDENGAITKAHTILGAKSIGALDIRENGNVKIRFIRIDEATPPMAQISVRCTMAVVTEFEMTFDDGGKPIDQKEIGTYSMQVIY